MAALIAALYAVVSVAFMPISFGVYQVRIAEALTVLPFLTAAAIPGLYVGCLLANVIGGMGWLDIVVGPLITLAAALLTYLARRLVNRNSGILLAALPIVGTWIGAVYFLTAFQLSSRTAVGSALSLASFGLMGLAANPERFTTARRGRFLLIGASLATAAVAVVLLTSTSDVYFIVFGVLLMLAAVLLVLLAAGIWTSGGTPNILIAPLPPVVLNALGVSLYLAPLLGFSYWFSVQMIAVGELIACYLLGLPLLAAVRKRTMIT